MLLMTDEFWILVENLLTFRIVIMKDRSLDSSISHFCPPVYISTRAVIQAGMLVVVIVMVVIFREEWPDQLNLGPPNAM